MNFAILIALRNEQLCYVCFGGRKVLSIEEYASYFKDIDPVSQYKNWTTNQALCRRDRSNDFEQSYNVVREKVKAAFVISDPVDWGRDIQANHSYRLEYKKLAVFSWRTVAVEISFNIFFFYELKQVLCDILTSGGLPGKENGHQPPLYFAADDLEYQVGN